MTSKRTAASKRAPLPRAADYAKSFLKDWERLSRAGRYNMNRLKEAMLILIADDTPLGPEWLDHALGGEWDGHRECHVGGDFCLPINWWTVPSMAWLFLFELGRTQSCLNRTFGAGIGLIDQAQHIQKNYNGGVMNKCHQCGAKSYKPVIERDDQGVMRPSGAFKCTGCSLIFRSIHEWRADMTRGGQSPNSGDPVQP